MPAMVEGFSVRFSLLHFREKSDSKQNAVGVVVGCFCSIVSYQERVSK